MNLKNVAGKTVFFVLICLFVALYSAAFGQENSLTGVVVVVLALMMLGQDLSVRPGLNLMGLVAFTLLMGVGAYVSVWCGNALVGAAVNFSVVFVLSYMTTQNLRSPMHFPFLLGYAFMLSVPVTAEGLPVRILALVAGSVFIVALNVLLNRNRHARTCHDGLRSVCEQVAACCRSVLEDGEADPGKLDSLCLGLRGSMYDRLRRSFFSTPGDHTVLDLVSALQMAGRAVCERERDPGTLADLESLMGMVAGHEDGRVGVSDVAAAATGFLASHLDADSALTASVVSLRDGLLSLSSGDAQERKDLRGRMRAVGRETARRDSARFTFAVRMSVVFTLFAFVWQQWDLENAKWLLFTAVALVLPYVDGAWRKSAMRVTGTLAGVVAFAAVALLFGGDVGLLTAALMLANYVYTVLDPKRYDVMMAFVTFSALVAASMSAPAGDAVAERVLFVLLGVVVSTAANFLLLPYRISDEDRSLGDRYLALNERMLGRVESSLRGDRDRDGETVDSLVAAGVSAKMHMNAETEPDGDRMLFLSRQDAVAAQCLTLCRYAGSLTAEGRDAALALLAGGEADRGSLEGADRRFVSVLSATLDLQEGSRVMHRTV